MSVPLPASTRGPEPRSLQWGDRAPVRPVGLFVLLAILAASFYGSEFHAGRLLSSAARTRADAFLAAWWPPRTDPDFLSRLLRGAVDTVGIAALGTAAAVLVAIPLGILGSRAVMYGALFATGDDARRPLDHVLFVCARGIGAFFRSIPEVIWALLFVRVLGLGPAPAIAAFALAYGGMLGKVYSELLEQVQPQPAAAIESVGAGRLSVLTWGILPQAFAPMASYTAYRFECAIRASTLMGFVGAGGLGFQIEISVGDYLWNEVLTEVALLVLIVAFFEWASDGLRRRLA